MFFPETISNDYVCSCAVLENGARRVCSPCRRRMRYMIRSHEGMRWSVFLRDQFQCKSCGSTKRLQIHYRNGNDQDRRVGNMITLCAGCHARVERSKIFSCHGKTGEALLLRLWKELHPDQPYQPKLL